MSVYECNHLHVPTFSFYSLLYIFYIFLCLPMSEVPDYPRAENCSQINWEAVGLLSGFGAYSDTNLTAAACLFGVDLLDPSHFVTRR